MFHAFNFILINQSLSYYIILHSFILSLTRSLIDDPEIVFSGPDAETPQDQEYFDHIAELQEAVISFIS